MANVTIIPARRQVGNNVKQAEQPKLRVAAYCRVSTDSDEQETSYQGTLDFAYLILDKIKNRSLEQNLAARVELPYTDWWYQQDISHFYKEAEE